MSDEVVSRRWLLPVDRVTKEQMQSAGFHTVSGVSKYEIRVVDEENPLLIPADRPDLAEFFVKQGEPVAFMSWDDAEKWWVDPVSGHRERDASS